MSTLKLTARQIETVRHVHDYMAQNGLPPTISDLRRLMGVASDQAVIEILQRLEDRGMVERTSGQARGIKLTASGCLVIGVAPPAGPSGLTPWTARPFELNPLQQRIFKRLAEIDPKLARMYEGGLRVLLDETNPERIPLSAHSIRESTHHLSNMGKGLLSKEEEKAAKDQKANNARQLEKLFDPLGGVSGFGPTLYDTWNREFQNFFVEVSHHGKEVSAEEYREKLFQYENFLNRYVLPLQVEIYALLDEQLEAGPEHANADELRALLSRNVESYRYFFRKADVRWLGCLGQHQLLSPRWEVADYLSRAAPDASADVMAVIESLKTDKNDWATRKGLIDAAAKMPPKLARRLLDKIDREQWLAEPYVDWLIYSIDPLIASFIAGSQHNDAARLISLLANRLDGEQKLKSHRLERVLKHISVVPAPDLAPYIKALVVALSASLSREGPESGDDLSCMWRPGVEDHEQNWRHGDPRDLLIVAIRDTLVRHVEHLHVTGGPDASAFMENSLRSDPPRSVFARLKLHLYRELASHFMREIEAAVTEYFDTTDAWHEYFLLLANVFPQLSQATQARYFEMVDRGPTRWPKGEPDEHYQERWTARKLAPILEHLSSASIERYGTAVAEARAIPHPDLLSYHSSGWASATSPVTEAELAAMSMDSVLDLLASWQPPPDIFMSGSHADLALTLSKVVGKNAEVFSREAPRFNDARLRPDYLHHLFSGLQKGLRNKAQLDWNGIVTLTTGILERARAGDLPVLEATPGDNPWSAEWNGVFQQIASLFEASLTNSPSDPEFALRGDIWRAIEFLCDHRDAATEREAAGSTSDLANLSLNTLHGRAFRALFAYVFWCDRHLKSKGENRSRIPVEAKVILERHLDRAYDPGLTVRSVCGEYFGWLYVYDPYWGAGLIDRVFPIDDFERRYAAWETYLANGFFPQLYKALKPQYEQAISDVRSFKPAGRFWADPIEGLAVHMMVAYSYREEGEKGAAWLKFFRLANPKQRGKAVNFCGTSYVQRDSGSTGERLPDTNRLQEFWEWRLKESKDVEELKEFGWWVREGKFNDEWMLHRLIATLERTGGDIVADFHVLSVLLTLAAKHPQLCAQALSLIVRSKSADRVTLGHSEDIPRILAALYSTGDADTTDTAENIIDHLTKLGFDTFREISQAQRKPVDPKHEGFDRPGRPALPAAS
ncbi:MAG: hypothetical protein ABSH49_00845 [Bryobacteraceae bacterium]